MVRQSRGLQLLTRSLLLAGSLSFADAAASSPAAAADPDPKVIATQQLRAELELLKTYDNGCASAGEAARDRLVDAQGNIEEKMQSRPKGALSSRERRDLARIDAEAGTQAILLSECYKKVNARRSEIAAILANPERLQAFGVAFLDRQQREAAAREAAQATALARQAFVEREVQTTVRSIFEETKSFADTLLTSPGPARPLAAQAADLQAKQRAMLNRLRGVGVKAEDRLLLEHVGKTWVHINEALQAIQREEAATTELASLQAQHEQARKRLAVQSTMVDRANFDQLTRALQAAEFASKDTRKVGEVRRGALRVAISDMTQTAEASK